MIDNFLTGILEVCLIAGMVVVTIFALCVFYWICWLMHRFVWKPLAGMWDHLI